MPKMTISGHDLHYQDVGEGYPVLFGHSFLWDSHMWKPQVDVLSKTYRCIVPDLWGHGLSDDPPEQTAYSVSNMADDYYILMKNLGFKEFAMVGLSVGGMIGVELALKYPKALSCLAILGSFAGAEPEVTFKKYNSMMDQADRNKRFTSELADAITPLFFSPSTLKSDPDLVHSFSIHLRSIPSERIKGVTNIGRGIFARPDRLNELSKIEIPSLVVVGEDDIPRPPREALQMAERLPNSSLVMLSQAGHISNLEQPDEITRELEKLLHAVTVSGGDFQMVS